MRNADKYKTAKERAIAFNRYCNSNSCQKCFDDCLSNAVPCLLKWLDIEAEEEVKPLPCPFCGKYTYTVDYDFLGYWGVKCSADGCWYHSHLCKTESEAIAVHNRVAKAAIDAKKNEVK